MSRCVSGMFGSSCSLLIRDNNAAVSQESRLSGRLNYASHLCLQLGKQSAPVQNWKAILSIARCQQTSSDILTALEQSCGAIVLDRLSQEIRTAFADPALQQRAIGIGTRLTGSTPEQVAERPARETPRWAEMVRISGATPE